MRFLASVLLILLLVSSLAAATPAFSQTEPVDQLLDRGFRIYEQTALGGDLDEIQKNLAEAKRIARRALEQDADSARAHYLLALIKSYVVGKAYDDQAADRHFMQAIDLDPDLRPGKNSGPLMLIYFELTELPGLQERGIDESSPERHKRWALTDLNTATKYWPDAYLPYFKRGRYRLAWKDYEKAVRDLRRARELCPGGGAETFLAKALLGAGRPQEALRVIEEPANGECSERVQVGESAFTFWYMGSRGYPFLWPRFRFTEFVEGRVYAANGEYDKALDSLNKCLDLFFKYFTGHGPPGGEWPVTWTPADALRLRAEIYQRRGFAGLASQDRAVAEQVEQSDRIY